MYLLFSDLMDFGKIILAQMIKTMMSQMGRTPSQKQVNQMMKQMNKFM